jgi:signal transduction histidine kinase
MFLDVQVRMSRGLGLTITHEAVDAHGGQLSVRDMPGNGCIFSVQLSATEFR